MSRQSADERRDGGEHGAAAKGTEFADRKAQAHQRCDEDRHENAGVNRDLPLLVQQLLPIDVVRMTLKVEQERPDAGGGGEAQQNERGRQALASAVLLEDEQPARQGEHDQHPSYRERSIAKSPCAAPPAPPARL